LDTIKTMPVDDLVEDLRVNMRLSQEILDILREENKALRGMATQELFRLSKQKAALLAKVNYLDDSLRDSIDKLRNDDAAPTNRDTPLYLSRLSADLPEEQASIVKQYCRGIKRLRLEIQSQNLINRRFTHDTLACLNEAISLISQPEPKWGSYGGIEHGGRRSISLPSLISKEV